jgi:hypothetical protein
VGTPQSAVCSAVDEQGGRGRLPPSRPIQIIDVPCGSPAIPTAFACCDPQLSFERLAVWVCLISAASLSPPSAVVPLLLIPPVLLIEAPEKNHERPSPVPFAVRHVRSRHPQPRRRRRLIMDQEKSQALTSHVISNGGTSSSDAVQPDVELHHDVLDEPTPTEGKRERRGESLW